MKTRSKAVAIALLVCLAITLVPVTLAVGTLAAEKGEDAMIGINAELSEYKLGETVRLASDGYIGIPVEYTVFFDTKGGTVSAVPGYQNGTPVILYVVNTNTVKAGTESDSSIIKSMLDRG